MAKKKITALEEEALIEVAAKTTHIRIQYHPVGAIKDLFYDKSDQILVSGPAGTGKSRGILEKFHLILSQCPGSKAFMSRKTRQSMTNSVMATFEERVIKPPDKVHLHKQEQCYNYPNGSKFAIIGLDDPEKLKSTDWDLGYINEATEATENDWEMATRGLRHWTLPFQQLVGDCNPDRPTHWLKRRCEKLQSDGTTLTKLLTTTHQDNPQLFNAKTGQFTEKGKAYLKKLDRMTGVRRSRLFLGLWVAAEGVVYEQWDPQVHMISRSELPKGWETWPHYWAIDWGYVHPFVWGDFIENPITGALYLLNEIYATGLLVEDAAKEILKVVDGKYEPRAIICDHDASDRASFERHTGFLTLPAYKSIATGIQNFQKRLQPDTRWGGGPGFYIVRDSLIHNRDESLVDAGCPTSTAEEFDGYVWDVEGNKLVNSRKDEIPIDKDNHGCDMTRYIAAFMDNLADDPEDIETITLFNEEYGQIISPF
jgi:phage terminase large subunit